MRTGTQRDGFTLVELLVVMTILATLLALTAVVLNSSFATSQVVNRGSDQVSGWLLAARQMARRDGIPTGVRFDVVVETSPTNAAITHNVCRTMRYIRQPDDTASGLYVGQVKPTDPIPAPTPPYNQNVARFQTAAKLGGVQHGDYLELFGGGILRRAVNFPGTTSPVREENPSSPNGFMWVSLAPPPGSPMSPTPPNYSPADFTGVPLPDSPTSFGAALTNYRFIHQPQPMSGEPVLTLNDNVAVDFTARTYGFGVPTPNPTNITASLSNAPQRSGFYEIVFGPSGAVIGQGTNAGMIFLWVRELRTDGTPDNSANRLAGRPVLITIQTRAGFIASHPVRAQGGAYDFARDGRNSGM